MKLRRTTRPGRQRCVELLETRRVFSASEFGLSNTAAVTLSFAPDGTELIDGSSALFAKFDQVAPTQQWQAAIRDAFQTWAVQTNADVGLIGDAGAPFGSPADREEPGFGDVRIGGLAMGEGVMALSIPQDIVSGSWVGDVLFNTDADFRSIDEIFAVAMHEAGNVFGLEDNNDPNSPMFSNGAIPTSTTPTSTDIRELQVMFGARAMDRNEDHNDPESRNDDQENATRLRTSNSFDGSIPTLAYGDISTPDDVDVYRLDSIDDYTGQLTIQVRSQGISQLIPRVRVVDRDGELVGEASTAQRGGEQLSLQIPADSDRYFIYVDSTAAGLDRIGGYSVMATFDDSLQATPEMVAEVSRGGRFRFWEQDLLREHLQARLEGDSPILNDDLRMNDQADEATKLDTLPGFAESTRYHQIASFSDPSDVDYYELQSADASRPIMTVRITALDQQPLSTDLEVFGRNGDVLQGTMLVNDGRDMVVQFRAEREDSRHLLRIAPRDLTASANYELNVTFDEEAVPLSLIGSGTLNDQNNVGQHSLTVDRHQITHFLLTPTLTAASRDQAVGLRMRRQGATEDLLTFAASSNTATSGPSILLAPGNYTVEAFGETLTDEWDYSIHAVEISDPLVALPDDPTDKPPTSDCPGLPPELCDPPAPLPGDATEDGAVNFSDFLVVSQNFGRDNVAWIDGDFNGDQVVSFADFLILSQHFGQTSGASFFRFSTMFGGT